MSNWNIPDQAYVVELIACAAHQHSVPCFHLHSLHISTLLHSLEHIFPSYHFLSCGKLGKIVATHSTVYIQDP